MARVLKDAYLASLGVISLTYDKAQKISDELIKKGELAKEKQQKFITDLLKEARKNTAEISKIINSKVEYLAKKGEPLKEKQDKLIKDLQSKAKKSGAVTEEKIKEAVKEIMVKSKVVKEKSQKIINDLKEKSISRDEAKIEETLRKLDIPTKEELKKINAKLDKLIKNYNTNLGQSNSVTH
jgi:polyhydroxyalkanoate synthesis regulator phasin